MSLEIQLLPALRDNYIFLVRETESGSVLVIDPGERGVVPNALEKLGWRPTLILNTHHHHDHVGGNQELREMFGIPLLASPVDGAKISGVDRFVNDGERISFGAETIRAIAIPGHTLGHTAYLFEKAGVVFVGDTLFGMGCGRLFEGTPQQMWDSLRRLMSLPDDTRIYWGHEYTVANGTFASRLEPDNTEVNARLRDAESKRTLGQPTLPSTIGFEKRTNPFLRAGSREMRHSLGLPDESTDVEVFAQLRARRDEFRI